MILANKLMLDQGTLGQAENLKLICVTATGVNNVDLDYAKSRASAWPMWRDTPPPAWPSTPLPCIFMWRKNSAILTSM